MATFDWEAILTKSQFAGESFEVDSDSSSSPSNIRTVYVGASSDNFVRKDRTIILIGDENSSKNVSLLVDFMCNYFYGIEYNYNYRLRVANECFDKTTPQTPVTKYVFNETVMPFRPVIITLHLHPSAYYHNNIAVTLSTYLQANTAFHSISFVLSAMEEKTISDKKPSRYFQLPEWLLQRSEKATPRGSLVLWLSYSQSEIDRCLFWASNSGQSSLYSTSSISSQLTIFHTSTQELLFSKPSADPLRRHLQQTHWKLTLANLKNYFEALSLLRPQLVSELLESEETSISKNIPISPDSAISSLETSLRFNQQTNSPCTPTKSSNTYMFSVPLEHKPFVSPVLRPESLAEVPKVIVIPKSKPKVAEVMENSLIQPGTVAFEQDSRYIVKETELIQSPTNKFSTDLVPFFDSKQREVDHQINDLGVFRRYVYDPNTLSYKIRFVLEVKLWKSTCYAQSSDAIPSALRMSHSISDLEITEEPEKDNNFKTRSQSTRTSLQNKRSLPESEAGATSNLKTNSNADVTDNLLMFTESPSDSKKIKFSSPLASTPSQPPSAAMSKRSFERNSTSRKASGTSRRGAARLAIANLAAMPPKPIIRPSIIVKDSCLGPELSKEMLKEMLKPIQIDYPTNNPTSPLLPNPSTDHQLWAVDQQTDGPKSMLKTSQRSPSKKVKQKKTMGGSLKNYCYFIFFPFLLIMLIASAIAAFVYFNR